MSLMINHSSKHAMLCQVLRRCPPAISVAAGHARSAFGSTHAEFARTSTITRSSHTFTDRSQRRVNGPTVFRISPDEIHSYAGTRAHLPIVLDQTRFKSALFDYDDCDHSELLRSAFDADLYKKVLQVNKKAHEDILKQAEEVLRGHVHDRTTSSLKILDLASGPGEPAAMLAKRFPEATIYSTDINPEMVKASDERMSSLGISNVKSAVVNMEDLSEFDNESFDLVTCSYGLMLCENPDMALYEIQRVLKPGGTFVTTVWDNISTERASDDLLKAACGNRIPPERIIDPMAMARPRLLEKFLEKNNLSLVKVSHGEYPFDFSQDDAASEDFMFRFVSMAVQPNLTELVQSGENPKAFSDAKEWFDNNIAHYSDWIKKKEGGGFVTVPNRYKLAVARRGYEEIERKKKPVAKTRKRLNLRPISSDSKKVKPSQVSEAFDSVLADTYSRISNGPWEHMLKCVESIVHGHDTSKIRILDLSSGPGGPVCMLAKRFPRASVVATDPSSKVIEQLKKKSEAMGLRNTRLLVADPQNLASFQTASYDVVTCSFGLSTLSEEDARKALQEVHRILKPGGSLVAAVWDSIAIEKISDDIMSELMQGETAPPRVIDYLSFAAPRKLEGLVESSAFSVIQVYHDEFSFQLSGLDHMPDDFAFNVATIPIHPNLVQLQNSGKMPNAIEKAHGAFRAIVDEGNQVHVDEQGRMWAGPNRFKIVIARRQYEDDDVGV